MKTRTRTLIVKHFEWERDDREQSGRIAVAVGQRFRLKRLEGNAPPVGIIPMVIAAMGESAVRIINDAHNRRRNRYAVEVRQGRSGCRDYLLREERDLAMKDHPIRCGLHVSMYHKLNQDVDVWAGDVLPLLISMKEEGEFNVMPKIAVCEVETTDWDFRRPGDERLVVADGRIEFEEEHLLEEEEDAGDGYLDEEMLDRLRQIQF